MAVKKIANRLKRVKGQVSGVERMLEKGRPCLEVVQQLMAAKQALSAVAVELLYRESCEADEPEELKKLIRKIVKEL